MAAELSQLKHKRGTIKHKLTNLTKFLTPIKQKFDNGDTIEELQLTELQHRLNKIEQIEVEFHNVQIEIEMLSLQGEQLHLSERDEFTNKISTTLAIAHQIINANTYKYDNNDNASVHSSKSQRSNNFQMQSNIKLPTINLPKFKGNYNEWLEFKDTYLSLIHKNNSINNIQKYHYLRASLEGDAIKVIASLEISSETYNTAWDLLCNRYDNTKLLINNHIKALFNIEPMFRESSAAMTNMIDTVYSNLRALAILKQPTQHWDTLIIYLITSKFDNNTSREWDHQKLTNEDPTLQNLTNFLNSRANFLETLHRNSNAKAIPNKNTKFSNKATVLVSTNNFKCKLCSNNHGLYQCEQFLKLSPKQRYDKVKELKLCTNCLRAGHTYSTCFSTKSCQRCKQKQNTLLHQEKTESEKETTSTADTQVSLSNNNSNKYILLSTVIVKVKDATNKEHACKALLDCGSQSNFITMKMCKKLNLKQNNTNISIIGINNSTSSLSKTCNITLNSRINNFSTTIFCFVIEKITDNLPVSKFDTNSWNIPKNINLADPKFKEPSEIDLLIGSELFWNLMLEGKLTLGKNMPIIQNTKLGWIVSGSIGNNIRQTYCHFSRNQDINYDLQNFWNIEEFNDAKLSSDDQTCEEHFTKNVKRDQNGRFIVNIPLKHSESLLGDSKQIAIKRLLHLERKFETDQKFKNKYIEFMNEYENLQHMTKLSEVNESQVLYYLPHHGVLHECSLTTKLRVVFDGSSQSDSGFSINDLQYTGPIVQNDIIDILLRFRKHKYVVCSDIEKMYRQILIQPSDRHLQCILWRRNPTESISTYTLNTLTYDTSSAPYLAIRCLKQLAYKNQASHPKAAKIMLSDFYVDDLITGFDDKNEATQMCSEIKHILETACLNLRKWVSNDATIIQSLQNNKESVSVLSLGDNEQLKILGIQWIPTSDTLTYRIELLPKITKITKRSILSDTAKIFDPLGLISPYIIVEKIMLQNLWSSGLEWDSDIPSDLEQNWLHFRNKISSLNDLQIKRHTICKNAVNIELHGFCDSSQSTYGACVYLLSTDSNNHTQISLLCAKTRVALIKTQTIPRLELCSAVILHD